MDKHAFECLVRFCIEQRNAFAARDWVDHTDIDAKTLTLVARYLSMTSWYGYEEELERIAARSPNSAVDTPLLYRESREIGFDLPRFSAMMRIGIAQSRQGSQPAPGREWSTES